MKQLRQFIRKVLLEKIHKEDFEDVMQTAQLAHMGQMRRDGTPYITHPMEVMEITKRHYPENYAAQLLALLHDVIEDGPSAELTEEELRQMIRGSITDPSELDKIEIALDMMTHDKDELPNYEDYLRRVFSNPLSSIVKLSDLIHNLLNNPSERQIIKYRTALSNVPIPKHLKRSQVTELMGILNADATTR